MKSNFLFLPLLLISNLSCASNSTREPATASGPTSALTAQAHISRIEQMANIPQPLKVIDFRRLALRFDKTVYDFNQKGPHWPVIWWDRSGVNFNQPIVALYTALGDVRQGEKANEGQFHEAVSAMGAVLGASLVGIDKSSQNGLDYVAMLKNYFNRDTGWDIMQNNTNPTAGQAGGGYGRDWWYDVYPNVMFFAIADLYPHEADFDMITRKIADRFYDAGQVLKGDYQQSFFNYKTMTPMKSQICAQPDVAAGHSWVLYNAYKKFGDEKYLVGSKAAMAALETNKINPSYEVLMPFGAYMAARLNAEQGTTYDVAKMIDWSLDGTAVCRKGWGALVGRWNGTDISGIVGSTVDNGGYGFLMNTYDMAWPLVPLVRYDQSFANAIGKYALNAANAAKLFYPEYTTSRHQTLKEQSAITKGVIGYEGLIKTTNYPAHQSSTTSPVAQGDGPRWTPGNPEVSQFSLYGSAHVGIFGGLVKGTNVEGILKLDLLATDFYHSKAYPTYLLRNPFAVAKKVKLELEPQKQIDVYDTVSKTFLAKNVVGSVEIKIAPESPVIVVFAPANGKMTKIDGRLMINDVVVDFHAN